MLENELFKKIKMYNEVFGPVGREEQVQELVKKNWEKFGVLTKFDNIGNLFGRIDGIGRHWAIVVHADSIGFIVQQVLDDGFIKLSFNTAATTPDARFLSGVPLKFFTRKDTIVKGYFGLRSGHIAGIEGKVTPILFEDLFVDIGVSSKQEAIDLGIDIGTPAVFDIEVKTIQKNLVGPSMDNRIGLAVLNLLLMELVKLEKKPNLTLISTVQEEMGLKGATAAAKSDQFDTVIVLDIGLSGDIPNTDKDFIPTALGKGPIIVYKDFSVHYHDSLIKEIEILADTEAIPIQRAVFKNYRTDGEVFFMEGHSTVMLAIPCRYTHTYFETVRKEDIFNMVKLIIHLINPK
ncbi:M42 family metallopeptidase [Candidatus Hodarchaeum mangrovi]